MAAVTISSSVIPRSASRFSISNMYHVLGAGQYYTVWKRSRSISSNRASAITVRTDTYGIPLGKTGHCLQIAPLCRHPRKHPPLHRAGHIRCRPGPEKTLLTPNLDAELITNGVITSHAGKPEHADRVPDPCHHHAGDDGADRLYNRSSSMPGSAIPRPSPALMRTGKWPETRGTGMPCLAAARLFRRENGWGRSSPSQATSSSSANAFPAGQRPRSASCGRWGTRHR